MHTDRYVYMYIHADHTILCYVMLYHSELYSWGVACTLRRVSPWKYCPDRVKPRIMQDLSADNGHDSRFAKRES